MTKDLSKQICEKCGIKPQLKKIECGARTSGMQLIEVYPDFAEPDNFVRLYETKYHFIANTTIGAEVTTATCASALDRKSFLEILLHLLSPDENDWNKEESKRIAKAIREAEWDYE